MGKVLGKIYENPQALGMLKPMRDKIKVCVLGGRGYIYTCDHGLSRKPLGVAQSTN